MSKSNATLVLILAVIAAACVGANRTAESTTNSMAWIPFTWVSDSVSGKQFDKLAINVPIQLEGIPHAFEAQFDLGATGTAILYEKNLSNYFKLYPSMLEKLDTTVVVTVNNKKNPVLKGLDLELGDVVFRGQQATLYKDYGTEIPMDSIKSSRARHVGTVGAGLAKGKYLIIDYPNQRLSVQDTIPANLAARTSFVNAKVGTDNRIKVPLSIDGETHHVMFDTGASLFPLSVGTENWYKYADSTQKDSLEVTSWGQKVFIYGAPSKVDVYLGKTKLPSTKVYSILNSKSFDNFYKKEGIIGLTGNAYFVNNVVVVDFKNKRFGVVQEL
ncbi:hypothetical protein POKO110462_22285 [Pontibacter korlensis]|uniref:hypothetical protein n=1 Tax=Pontibacter korlensis TaxID=400092 RepID=UPI000695DB61|nr:hypothetical protein [Pontibacter korlensis]